MKYLSICVSHTSVALYDWKDMSFRALSCLPSLSEVLASRGVRFFPGSLYTVLSVIYPDRT